VWSWQRGYFGGFSRHLDISRAAYLWQVRHIVGGGCRGENVLVRIQKQIKSGKNLICEKIREAKKNVKIVM